MQVLKRKFQGCESHRHIKSREEKFAQGMKKVASAVSATNVTMFLLDDIPDIAADTTPPLTLPAMVNIPLLADSTPIITVSSAAAIPAQSGLNTAAPTKLSAPHADLDVTMKLVDGTIKA